MVSSVNNYNLTAYNQNIQRKSEPTLHELKELEHSYRCICYAAEVNNRQSNEKKSVAAEQILAQLKSGKMSPKVAKYQQMLNEALAERAYQVNNEIIRRNLYNLNQLYIHFPELTDKKN